MDQLIALLSQHGLAVVFLNVLATQAGVPVPALPMLVIAGAAVARGDMGLLPLLAVSVLASLIGDSAWYAAGKRYGRRVLSTLCRIAIEPDSCVKRTEDVFERWGPPSIMVAKYVPGFAMIAPPLAGMVRLAWPLFILYSIIAALLWIGLPVAAGMVFHAEVALALDWLESMGTGALLLAGAAITLYVSAKLLERYLLIRLLRTVRISVDELRALMAQPLPPVVLDARSIHARRLEPRRLPGAIAVDIEAPHAKLHDIPHDRDVIVYCS